MGLVVVVDASKNRVVHIGEGKPSGLKVTPQWLTKAKLANPSTYKEYNTDRLQTRDEGVAALLWIVEDLHEQVRMLTLDVARLQSEAPQATMGGG